VPEEPPVGNPPKRWRTRVSEALLGYGFIAPALMAMAVFAYYPLGQLVSLSLHRETRFGTDPVWVGTQQLVDTLTGSDFLEGVANSALFMVYTVPLGIVLGVLLAVSAHRRMRGIRVYQMIFSSTVATSVAVAGVIFVTLVNPVVGYFKDVPWLSLSNPDTALFSVSISSVWQNLGLTFIVILASLQAVPEELNEAATLDGYSAARRFFRVTVPLISPALMFLAVVLVVHALQAYAQIEILTNGGPGTSTETLLFKIADPSGIRSVGTKASMSIGLFALTAAMAGMQYGFLSRRVHYGD
jgi:sn-glycerol 3-phosphate transport system permease protein